LETNGKRSAEKVELVIDSESRVLGLYELGVKER
jgi:hypothetical protein